MQTSSRARMLTVALPITATVLAGTIGGFLVDLRMGVGSGPAGMGSTVLVLAIATVYGLIIGELLGRLCGQAKNPRLETLTAMSLVFGGLGGRMFVACLVGCQMLTSPNAQDAGHCATNLFLLVMNPMTLVSLALAVSAAVARIRTLQHSI